MARFIRVSIYIEIDFVTAKEMEQLFCILENEIVLNFSPVRHDLDIEYFMNASYDLLV